MRPRAIGIGLAALATLVVGTLLASAVFGPHGTTNGTPSECSVIVTPKIGAT